MTRPEQHNYLQQVEARIKEIDSNPVEAARIIIGGIICTSILVTMDRRPSGLTDQILGEYVGMAARLGQISQTSVAQIFTEEALTLRAAFGNISPSDWIKAIVLAGGGGVNQNSIIWLKTFAIKSYNTNLSDSSLLQNLQNLIRPPLMEAQTIPQTTRFGNPSPAQLARSFLTACGFYRYLNLPK